MKYRTKPVAIEAAFIDYDKIHVVPDEFRALLCDCATLRNEWPYKRHVHTPTGGLAVRDGEYLIRDENGRLSTCKSDLFETLYERMQEGA